MIHVVQRDFGGSGGRPGAEGTVLSGGPSLGLPPDLLASAAARLTEIALLYSAVYLVQYTVHATLDARQALPAEHVDHAPLAPLTIVFVGLSLAVVALARSGRISSASIPDLGLVYLVIGAAGIEITLLWLPTDVPFALIGLSWVVVWLAVFPLIVPAPPGKMLLAALIAAALRPLMILILVARGRPAPEAGVLVMVLFPNLLAVGLAVIGSRTILGLGKEVSRARRLGSYALVERLGTGGMGEVWRAEHRLLARPAAIKLIRPEALGQAEPEARRELLKRFEREVQATAVLSSPHTVQVHDFGVTSDSTFYYVMELLRGLNAEDLVTRFGPVPAARTAHILRQVCESLAEAHEMGLVHRDIKPANVFLCRRGLEYDFVKVLDFGLVKAAMSTDRAETLITARNVATGTPAFMAPEVALGGECVDGRTDLYSTGCLGYWLLSGHLVFEGDNAMQIMMAHTSREPEPPSRRTEARIPEDLERVVMECLSKDPGRRPASALDLQCRLEELRFDEPWNRAAAGRWWHAHLPEVA